MQYEKQNFNSGQKLLASHLNHIEDGINGEYRIYYSAQNEIQKYGLGVCTSDKLSGFVGKW